MIKKQSLKSLQQNNESDSEKENEEEEEEGLSLADL